MAIAGGGIVGCACALSCAARGMSVLLAEADALGSGATAAGMGHLVAMDDSEAQFALARRSLELWEQLELAPSAEYNRIGTLWIAADQEEMAGAERRSRWYVERGVATRLLTATQLAAEEPGLRPGLAGGLLVLSDAVVYPPRVAAELARRAQRLGATLRIGKRVTALAHGRMELETGEQILADRLINTLGASAPSLSPGLPVRPRKGHLVITDRYPGAVRHQLVELGYLKSAHGAGTESVAFNVQPRPNGQLLIGSSRQFGAEGSEVEPRMVSLMLKQTLEYLPAAARLSAIRSWTGFRAATPDKLPLIGPDPRDPTLWLATGHEGLGITTSLATAELLSSAFAGATAPIAIEPYLPARFPSAPAPAPTQKEQP